jgi:hypothetical protein
MGAQLSVLEPLAYAYASDVSAPDTPAEVQLPLFVQPELAPAKPTLVRGMAASDIGEAGEAIFEGSCRAWGLPLHKAGRGQIGPDYYVNGWRVQVKATASIHRDGRLNFQAGSSKRFIDYAGCVDIFAFVYAGLEGEHYGRSMLLPVDEVISRWRGRCVKIRPIELPRTPDLRMLVPTRE